MLEVGAVPIEHMYKGEAWGGIDVEIKSSNGSWWTSINKSAIRNTYK